jgi:hypothetical protein
MLERDLLPWPGSRPVASITAPEILASPRRIEACAAIDTTRRARIVVGQISRFVSCTRSMSENAILVALRAMGYPKDVMTGDGFRAMALTMLDEVPGYRVDLIEHQLAHAVRDANRRADKVTR